MSNLALLVGLGNPGPKYELTRHNAGAWWIRAVAQKLGVTFQKDAKLSAFIADVFLEDTRLKLLIPNSFMNLSSKAVWAALNYFQLSPEQTLIAHDEIDLPVGTMRLKLSGGHGGHNGLRSIFEKKGTSEFVRLRIGVGRPLIATHSVSDYVLHPPTAEEKISIDKSITQSLTLLPNIIQGQWSSVMNQLHGVTHES